MAWKAKIVGVTENGNDITVEFDVLNDKAATIAGSQSVLISNPTEATISCVKGAVLDAVKKLQNAKEVSTKWKSFIGQTIEVD